MTDRFDLNPRDPSRLPFDTFGRLLGALVLSAIGSFFLTILVWIARDLFSTDSPTIETIPYAFFAVGTFGSIGSAALRGAGKLAWPVLAPHAAVRRLERILGGACPWCASPSSGAPRCNVCGGPPLTACTVSARREAPASRTVPLLLGGLAIALLGLAAALSTSLPSLAPRSFTSLATLLIGLGFVALSLLLVLAAFVFVVSAWVSRDRWFGHRARETWAFDVAAPEHETATRWARWSVTLDAEGLVEAEGKSFEHAPMEHASIPSAPVHPDAPELIVQRARVLARLVLDGHLHLCRSVDREFVLSPRLGIPSREAGPFRAPSSDTSRVEMRRETVDYTLAALDVGATSVVAWLEDETLLFVPEGFPEANDDSVERLARAFVHRWMTIHTLQADAERDA